MLSCSFSDVIRFQMWPADCCVGMQVDDLVDVNMLRQGEPGYSNEVVTPADSILSIDGRDAQWVSLPEIHNMLRGKWPALGSSIESGPGGTPRTNLLAKILQASCTRW